MSRRTSPKALDVVEIHALIAARFPSVTLESGDAKARWIQVPSDVWLVVATVMRDLPELRFDSLMCLSGIDLSAMAPAVALKSGTPKPPVVEPSVACVYHLHSLDFFHYLTVKVLTDRHAASVPSVENIWPVAGYFEREVFDLFGVDFPGHHRLERIMCPDDWVGHAGRRDYVYPTDYHGITLKREGQRFDDGPYMDPAPTDAAKKKAGA